MANAFAHKSEKTWQEGSECLAREHFNSAANRLYYSVFQAVKGFAIKTGKMSEDASDGVHRLALKLVGSQGAQRHYYQGQLNKLYSLRLIADYKPESVDAQRLKDLVKDADSIRKYFIRIAGS